MADVRKLLARLNPANARYGEGRGGIPDLTPIDIAGALGFVQNKLGREVLCYCWWPDGAQLTERELDGLLANRMHEEMERLRSKRQRAELDLHIAQENMAARRNPSQHDRQYLVQCVARMESARAQDWPVGAEVYVRMRKAILSETKEPNRCAVCAGRGHVMGEELLRLCEKCEGKGFLRVTDMQRAAAIGVDKSRYSRSWRRPFEWAVAVVNDAWMDAARELTAALKKDIEPA